jgi:hypothetical protein
MRGSCLDHQDRRSSANPPPAAVDLRVASFVASNGVLQMLALCTVFIVMCTDGLGEHGDIDEFGTRNASFTHCPCRALVVRQRSMDVSLRRSRGGIPLRDGQGAAPSKSPPSRKPLPLAGLRTTHAYASRFGSVTYDRPSNQLSAERANDGRSPLAADNARLQTGPTSDEESVGDLLGQGPPRRATAPPGRVTRPS